MAYQRRRKKKQSSLLARQLFFGGGILILLALLCYGIWWGTHHPKMAIDTISVTGGSTVPHERIEGAVWDALRGNQYLLVSKKFKYLYPHVSVRESVNAVPRVHDVSVEREGKTLHVSFEEYIPHALWCDAPFENTCIFLTKEGFGFDEAPNLQGGVFVRYITETASSTPNTQAFTSEEMERGSGFIRILQDTFGFDVTSVTYTAAGDEVYLLARGSSIMRAGSESIEDSLEKLETILSSEQFAHLTGTSFAYIDLRFGNRVFVKEEESLPEEE